MCLKAETVYLYVINKSSKKKNPELNYNFGLHKLYGDRHKHTLVPPGEICGRQGVFVSADEQGWELGLRPSRTLKGFPKVHGCILRPHPPCVSPGNETLRLDMLLQGRQQRRVQGKATKVIHFSDIAVTQSLEDPNSLCPKASLK